jgi:hypothetical protein
MRKIILIAALLLASPALAEPLPVRMVGSCPAGYASGVDWCVPMPGTTREAVQKIGQCPPGWITSGAYCLGPEKPRRTRQSLIQRLQDRFGAGGW